MADAVRLKQLQAMLDDDPTDPFLHYGIAMEQVGLGLHDQAVDGFRELMRLSPDYVPAYLMLGQTYQKLGRVDEAVKVLNDGVVVARKVGNEHALSEMMGLLAILE